MAWFLFGGDMLVMLFMIMLVVWVSTSATRSLLDYSARIPLEDDLPGAGPQSQEGEQDHG